MCPGEDCAHGYARYEEGKKEALLASVIGVEFSHLNTMLIKESLPLFAPLHPDREGEEEKLSLLPPPLSSPAVGWYDVSRNVCDLIAARRRRRRRRRGTRTQWQSPSSFHSPEEIGGGERVEEKQGRSSVGRFGGRADKEEREGKGHKLPVGSPIRLRPFFWEGK